MHVLSLLCALVPRQKAPAQPSSSVVPTINLTPQNRGRGATTGSVQGPYPQARRFRSGFVGEIRPCKCATAFDAFAAERLFELSR